MTQTLRDLMEANDEQPDQHVRETFMLEDADGQPVEIDVIGHYDGAAQQRPDSTTIRVWDPMTAQAFIDRPYVPDLLIRENVSKDYPGVPEMVNAMIDTIQTDGVDSLRDTDD